MHVWSSSSEAADALATCEHQIAPECPAAPVVEALQITLAWSEAHRARCNLLCRLWPPPASQLRPAPIECLTADVAASVVTADLPVLWMGLVDDADGRTDDASGSASTAPYYCADFVRPSEAVFPPVKGSEGAFTTKAQRDTVLRVCRLLGVQVVQPPAHIEKVPLAKRTTDVSHFRFSNTCLASARDIPACGSDRQLGINVRSLWMRW